MQLAVLKLVRTRSSISLLKSLLAAPAGLDQLLPDSKCLRCGIHSGRPRRNGNDRATTSAVNGLGRRRCYSQSVQQPEQEHASHTELQRKKKITQPGRSTSRENNKAADSALRLSNHLTQSGAFRPNELQLDPEKLSFESDVGHFREFGSKLVDGPRYARDFELWTQLLLHRKRHHGDDGIIDIWNGLRKRGPPIDLPVDGDHAHLLWEHFIGVGLKREQFMHEIHSYVSKTYERCGKRWEGYYDMVVRGFFEEALPSKAVAWHERLRGAHFPSDANDALLRLFKPASSVPGGLKAFRTICATVDNHHIYGDVVPFLSKAKRVQHALGMHDFLLRRNDLPQKLKDVEALFEYFERYGSKGERKAFLGNLAAKGIFPADQKIPSQHPPPIAESKGLQSSAKDEENCFNDELGARLFATKPFTFELVLGGIKVFGANAIGPQTLRQLALRTAVPGELVRRINLLQKEGISIGKSVFSRAVRQLALSGHASMLNELLQSDQHPDVLEDPSTQEKLLHHYSRLGDSLRANMTLRILSILSHEDAYTYNIQLRNAVILRDWTEVSNILGEMSDHRIRPSEKTLTLMREKILAFRRQGSQGTQDRGSLRAIWYLISSFQSIIISGGEVPADHWREVLKRVGMNSAMDMKDAWQDLRKLCFWLVHFYTPAKAKLSKSGPISRTLPSQPIMEESHEKLLPPAHADSPIRMIFSVHLQQALIAWGFSLPPSSKEKYQNPFSEEGENIIPWVRGLVLLRQLKEKGVIVQTNTVRKAIRQRLAVLFGVYRRSNRVKNRRLRRENPWTLEQILHDINRVWGRSLFGELEKNPYLLVNPRPRARGLKAYNQAILDKYGISAQDQERALEKERLDLEELEDGCEDDLEGEELGDEVEDGEADIDKKGTKGTKLDRMEEGE
ncbi:hypothetical protein FQN53_001855 [Emmonsiellopsis sp. PD_33]|nr:hypothetical protein FQN53_001855 [Emmonsiellopsis sp. PD_33]